MSEDTLSSRPPSLPMATTMSSGSESAAAMLKLGEVAHRPADLFQAGAPAEGRGP